MLIGAGAVFIWATLGWNARGRHFLSEWAVLGAFMTFSTQFTTSTFLHSESIWINLQVSISVFIQNTFKNWQLEAVWLNICNVDAFFSRLGAPKIQCLFHYQSHNFLCNFAAFLFWDISILYSSYSPKKLQMNTSMQMHRLFCMLKFESFFLGDQKENIKILQCWEP